MLSLPHLVVIFVVALVIFGPEKLPELARTLGKLTAEFRKVTGDLRSSFDEQMRQLEIEAAGIERKKRELAEQQAAMAKNAPAESAPAAHFTIAPSVAPPEGEAAAAPELENPPENSANARSEEASGTLRVAPPAPAGVPHQAEEQAEPAIPPSANADRS